MCELYCYQADMYNSFSCKWVDLYHQIKRLGRKLRFLLVFNETI